MSQVENEGKADGQTYARVGWPRLLDGETTAPGSSVCLVYTGELRDWVITQPNQEVGLFIAFR